MQGLKTCNCRQNQLLTFTSITSRINIRPGKTLQNVQLSSKAAFCLQDHQNAFQRASKVASTSVHDNAYKRATVVKINSLRAGASQVASTPDNENAYTREVVVQISSLPSKSSQVASNIIKRRIETRP